MPVIEEESHTIASLLDRACDLNGESLAVVTPTGERWSYLELRAEVTAMARGLIGLGVEPGDRVALWMPNSSDWLTVYLATCLIGSVLVPINTALKEEEAEYIIAASRCNCLIVSAAFRQGVLLGQAEKILARRGHEVKWLVVAGAGERSQAVTLQAVVALGSAVDPTVTDDRRSRVTPSDPALLLYTSGSTGRPKGAVHNQTMAGNLVDFAERVKLGPADTVVLYLPLFHVFGVAAVLSFLYGRVTMVLMEKFDAELSLKLMEEMQATVVYGVTPMYCDQLDHPDFDSYKLEAIRLCLVPGSPDLIRRVSGSMGLAMNVYGMTETSSMTCVPNPEDSDEQRSETVGYPMPSFDVKVVREDGSVADPDETGELVVRGTPVMRGYWEDDLATSQVLEPNGWFHTGDAAQQRLDGYIRYMGRIKDMLKVGGENVDPMEVENVLMRHPAVSLAVVVGKEDVRLGEVPIAYVQLKPGSDASATDIGDFAKERLAFYKVPRRTVVVGQIPLTGSGKVQKHVVAGWAREDA
jgi:fatty-acyl-CoA synthase